jgi:hypothetical protein
MLGVLAFISVNQRQKRFDCIAVGRLLRNGFGLVVFFFRGRQFINDDVESRPGLNVQGLTHYFELNAVITLRTAGKNLSRKQRHLMRKTMPFMSYPIYSTLRHSFIGTEFVRFHHMGPKANKSFTSSQARMLEQAESLPYVIPFRSRNNSTLLFSLGPPGNSSA